MGENYGPLSYIDSSERSVTLEEDGTFTVGSASFASRDNIIDFDEAALDAAITAVGGSTEVVTPNYELNEWDDVVTAQPQSNTLNNVTTDSLNTSSNQNTGSLNTNTNNSGSGLQNPIKGGVSTVPGLLNLIINSLIIPIGGVIVVFMIIYTGFLFVLARGDESALTKAKSSLVHTAIGAAIILGAFALSAIIESVLGQITDAI